MKEKKVEFENEIHKVETIEVKGSLIHKFELNDEKYYKVLDITKYFSKELDKSLNSKQLINRVEDGILLKVKDLSVASKVKSWWVDSQGLEEILAYYSTRNLEMTEVIMSALEIETEDIISEFNEDMEIDFEPEDDSTILIEKVNGKPYVSTLHIAAQTGKKHYHILDIVDNLSHQQQNSVSANFDIFEHHIITKKYLDTQGRRRRYILLDNIAFTFVICNFSGYHDYKWAYINKFEEMRQELLDIKNGNKQVDDIQSVDKIDNGFINKFKNYRVTDIANELGVEPYELNHFLCRKGIQYKDGERYFLTDLHSNNLIKEAAYRDEYGKVKTFMVWTQEGRDFILNYIEECQRIKDGELMFIQ